MKIDGKILAQTIKEKLKKKIINLKKRGVAPHLAIIYIGNDSNSLSYIKQKLITAKELGVKVSLKKYHFLFSKKNLIALVNKLNLDKNVNGIIIQRPLAVKISKEDLNQLVAPEKDVDGFSAKSLFDPPLGLAVKEILKYIFSEEKEKLNFWSWLGKKKIVIIGRGETGGKPIAKFFKKKKIKYYIAHSQTKNLKEKCLNADILIPCVGKPNIVRPNMVTKKTILIGVGMSLEEGKLGADYNQEKIKNKVAFYTPVPGGVGPVNVACLFSNLIKAAN